MQHNVWKSILFWMYGNQFQLESDISFHMRSHFSGALAVVGLEGEDEVKLQFKLH